MDRRSFLTGGMGLAATSLLTGCDSQPRSTLNVRLLKGSIPAQIINAFRTEHKQAALAFAPEPQLQGLFSLLQAWKLQPKAVNAQSHPFLDWVGNLPIVGDRQRRQIPTLVTLGDTWLQTAIQQQLILPFDSGKLTNWSQLPQSSQWNTLVRRNAAGQPDPQGQVWAAPYRFGTTLIIYRQDIFQQRDLKPPTDWDDLWRTDLARQIALLDQPRAVIGMVLKKLGKSYNLTDLNTVPALNAALEALRPQVKLYSSENYLQPLLLGDVWLAVGWSTEILPLLPRSQTLRAVVPQSGTALWADLWVQPQSRDAETLNLARQWIDFCWQPDIATQLSILSRATSPVLLTQPQTALPNELRQNPLLLPDSKILNASEFLLPLPETTVAQYQTLWEKLRSPD